MKSEEQVTATAEAVLAGMDQNQFPYLTELTREHVLNPGYEVGKSFEVGLELILDGLEQLRDAERDGRGGR